MALPDRTTANTAAEHVSDHNVLHNQTQFDRVVRYVETAALGGDDGNDGRTPLEPKLTISSAYTSLPANGGTIFVGDGTFDVGSGLSFTSTKPVRLIGSTAWRGATTTGNATYGQNGTILTRTAASYGTGISNRAIIAIGGSAIGRGFLFQGIVFELLDPSTAGETAGIYTDWALYSKVQDCLFFSKNAVGWGIYATATNDFFGWRIRDNWSQSCGLFKKIPGTSTQGNQIVIDGNICHLGTNPVTTNNFVSLDTVHRSVISSNNFEAPAGAEMTQACVYYTGCQHNIQIGNGGERTQIMAEVNNSKGGIFSDVGVTPVNTVSNYKLVKFTGSSSGNMVYPRGWQGDDATNTVYTSPIQDDTTNKRNWYLAASMETMDAGFTMHQRMPYSYVGKGAPTHSARRGALYSQIDGTGASTTLYVNTSTGIGTTWTAVAV